jgi:hypothetical protein
MIVRTITVESHGAAAGSFRLGDTVCCFACKRQIDARHRDLGIQHDCTMAGRGGFLELTQFKHHAAQAGQGHRILRPQTDRLPTRMLCFFQASRPEHRGAQVGMCDRHTGPQGHRSLRRHCGFGKKPLFQERPAQIGVGRAALRIKHGGVSIGDDGLREFAACAVIGTAQPHRTISLVKESLGRMRRVRRTTSPVERSRLFAAAPPLPARCLGTHGGRFGGSCRHHTPTMPGRVRAVRKRAKCHRITTLAAAAKKHHTETNACW